MFLKDSLDIQLYVGEKIRAIAHIEMKIFRKKEVTWNFYILRRHGGQSSIRAV